jgi:hypothetical protein
MTESVNEVAKADCLQYKYSPLSTNNLMDTFAEFSWPSKLLLALRLNVKFKPLILSETFRYDPLIDGNELFKSIFAKVASG